jgi:hypothetical protein
MMGCRAPSVPMQWLTRTCDSSRDGVIAAKAERVGYLVRTFVTDGGRMACESRYGWKFSFLIGAVLALCREAAHSVATRPVEGILARTYIVRSSFGRVKYLVQRKKEYLLNGAKCL